MTNRERMTAVMENRVPDRIPYCAYDGFFGSTPELKTFIPQGLCNMKRIWVIDEITPTLEKIVKNGTSNGYKETRVILKTSLGELEQVSYNDWIQEYFLKTPDDYRVMNYIIQNTDLKLNPEIFEKWDEELGDTGLPIINANRTPIQTMLVDYAGLENFSYHIMDDFPEFWMLYESLYEHMISYFKLVAEGPGRYVQIRENLTSEQIGPARYKQYHMKAYEDILGILHSSGKKAFAHYDGKIACLVDLISQTGLDGIDSLTSPPEGDMTFSEVRKVLPDKVFWGHINLSNYMLPRTQLRELIYDLVRQAAPDGRNLLFELSEDLPENWRESIPLVLETLNEIDLNNIDSFVP